MDCLEILNQYIKAVLVIEGNVKELSEISIA